MPPFYFLACPLLPSLSTLRAFAIKTVCHVQTWVGGLLYYLKVRVLPVEGRWREGGREEGREREVMCSSEGRSIGNDGR